MSSTGIPIKAVKEFAKSQGCSQMIVMAYDGENRHVATWGDTVERCDHSAQVGDKLKDLVGWTDMAKPLPSRVVKLKKQLKTLSRAFEKAVADTKYVYGETHESVKEMIEYLEITYNNEKDKL